MLEQNNAVSCRVNNDSKPSRYSTELYDDEVINGFVFRAKLFEGMKHVNTCSPIIEAGLDD